MKKALLGGLLVLLFAYPALCDEIDLEPVACVQFKAGYDALSAQPLFADNASFALAASAIADNHLILNKSETAYMTREQIQSYLSALKPIDALIWLQSTYTSIETQLKRCLGSGFEQKRLELRAPKLAPEKPGTKACGGPMPDLSKPLAK